MASKLILTALLLFLDFTSSCKPTIDENTILCPSIAEAAREAKPNWKSLKINNFGNETFKPIKRWLFRSCPNLDTLSIQGSANEIAVSSLQSLQDLNKIELLDNRLSYLPGEVFRNLPLELIYVVNCSIKALKPGTFQELDNLRVLYFRNNSVRVIPSNVFSESNAEELYLENNGVEFIEKFAFLNMPKLFKLSLSANKLTSFDIPSLFGTNSLNLLRIWLNQNKLTHVPKDMFILLPKLKYLFLEQNQITNIEDGAFNGLPKLKGLDLSNNKLYTISPKVFPASGMQEMDILFLHNNRMTFLNDILERAPSIKYFNFYGNPIQCKCQVEMKNYFVSRNITQVCDANDEEGRPICIQSKNPAEQKYCIKDVDKFKYLYDDFIEMTGEYDDWQKKCHFLEGYESLNWITPGKY